MPYDQSKRLPTAIKATAPDLTSSVEGSGVSASQWG